MNRGLLLIVFAVVVAVVFMSSQVVTFGSFPPVETDMLLFYHLDNNSAIGEDDATAVDSSLESNNGTINEAIFKPGTGILGGSFEFDGVDDWIDLPDILDATSAFTYSIWINSTNIGDNNFTMMGEGGSIAGYSLDCNTNDCFFNLRNSSTDASGLFQAIANITGNFSQHTWHHVVGAYGDSRAIIYVDGNLKNNVTAPASIPTVANQAFIGDEDGSVVNLDGAFNGTIDEPIIYNRTLSSTQILILYEEYTTGNQDPDQWWNETTDMNLTSSHNLTNAILPTGGNLSIHNGTNLYMESSEINFSSGELINIQGEWTTILLNNSFFRGGLPNVSALNRVQIFKYANTTIHNSTFDYFAQHRFYNSDITVVKITNSTFRNTDDSHNFNFVNNQFFTVDDVIVHNASGGGNCFQIRDGGDANISNMRIYECDDRGFFLHTNPTNMTFTNITINTTGRTGSNGHCAVLNSVHNSTFDDINVNNCTLDGFSIDGSLNVALTKIDASEIRGTGVSMSIDDTENMTIGSSFDDSLDDQNIRFETTMSKNIFFNDVKGHSFNFSEVENLNFTLSTQWASFLPDSGTGITPNNITFNNLTDALFYDFFTNVTYGNSDTNSNDGSVETLELTSDNKLFFLNHFNLTEGVTRAKSPLWITSRSSFDQESEEKVTYLLASNISTINVSFIASTSCPNPDDLVSFQSDSGLVTTPGYHCIDSNTVQFNLTQYEAATGSNELIITYLGNPQGAGGGGTTGTGTTDITSVTFSQCQDIFFFIVGHINDQNKLKYTSDELSDLSEDLNIEDSELNNIILNYDSVCEPITGLQIPQPIESFDVPIFDDSSFSICNVDAEGVFNNSWNIIEVNIGERTCGFVDVAKSFVRLEQEDSQFVILGIRYWWLIVVVVLITLYMVFISNVKLNKQIKRETWKHTGQFS